jgi:dTDP-4-amino-4,6-dideoxygalactose transaminase
VRKANAPPRRLALLGGTPAFREALHVGRPNRGSRAQLLSRVNDLLDRDWLSNRGPLVSEFEERVAQVAGTRHCIAMCNGTIALELLICALELSGEVIVPSFTFIATVHALQRHGVVPVFCDIEPETFCIDSRRVSELITPRTSGILGVHCWGRPCDVEALEEVARRYSLKLLFDAAHAFGCSRRGRPVGSFGEAEVFSFHATKFVNAGEGGAVVTNDDDLAATLRLMKNFGFSGYDNVVCLGTNGKMAELAAAMGLTSLESMGDFVETNQNNYLRYQRELRELPGIDLIGFDANEKQNYQYVTVLVNEGKAGLSRDQLLQVLHAENVLARRYFYPGCHRMEPYRTLHPHAGSRLPITERTADSVLILPTGQAVGPEDIAQIAWIIRTALEKAGEVRFRCQPNCLSSSRTPE